MSPKRTDQHENQDPEAETEAASSKDVKFEYLIEVFRYHDGYIKFSDRKARLLLLIQLGLLTGFGTVIVRNWDAVPNIYRNTIFLSFIVGIIAISVVLLTVTPRNTSDPD